MTTVFTQFDLIRQQERLSKKVKLFSPGMLVLISSKPDAPRATKKLDGKIGMIVRNIKSDISKNYFCVLINEKIHQICVIDIELLDKEIDYE